MTDEGKTRPPVVQVESRSRPGRFHEVDLEIMRCTCEAFAFRNTCRHLGEAEAKQKKQITEGE
jgi:hypothetical protein